MDRVVLCWWALTGLIHVFQEGYYVFTPDLFKDDSPNFMAEICKYNIHICVYIYIYIYDSQYLLSKEMGYI